MVIYIQYCGPRNILSGTLSDFWMSFSISFSSLNGHLDSMLALVVHLKDIWKIAVLPCCLTLLDSW